MIPFAGLVIGFVDYSGLSTFSSIGGARPTAAQTPTLAERTVVIIQTFIVPQTLVIERTAVVAQTGVVRQAVLIEVPNGCIHIKPGTSLLHASHRQHPSVPS